MPRSTTPARVSRAPLVLALVAALLTALAGGADATRSDRTTWALAPSGADGPDGRVSFRHTLDPGAEVTEHVTLTNFSAHAASFHVWAGDGVLTADGQFDLPPTGTAPVAAGAWIALGDRAGAPGDPGAVQHVELGPGEAVSLPFSVRVPADAVPGDHPAGIVAALADGPEGGVGVDSRVGVRLHLRVSGDVVTALAVPGVTATYAPSWNPFRPGVLRLEHVIANAGDVRLGAAVVASAAGPLGLGARTDDGPDVREVLPGAEVAVTTELPAWPLGRLAGDVTVTPAVVGDDVLTGASVLVVQGWSVWALPWSQLGLVLLVVAAAVAVPLVRRRRADAVQRRVDEAVAAARAAAPRGWGP